MKDEAVAQLTREQVLALKFAARRQLARWSNKRGLSSHQQGQRVALSAAASVLQAEAFANGCELRAPSTQGDR
jgi:hypothetical protein